MSLLILATSEFIHAVLLNIVTQSLTIGECTDYFGSHDSDNRNDSGRVRMLMYGPACPCMCQHASVHSCSAGPWFFLENTSLTKITM